MLPMPVPQFVTDRTPSDLHGSGRFLIPRREFVPAYLKSFEEGTLKSKVDEALGLLRSCTLCPRNCKVDRLANRSAVCKSGRRARVSSAFLHFGEEACLRGSGGSGTIFFAWCNLRCIFCQNYETSPLGEGEDVTPRELASIMLRLQDAGCHNINLVTPEHVVPQILEALLFAAEGGLRLPLVYNTSGYDGQESLGLMDRVVDIYMPDFKLWNTVQSLKYLLARDYAESARRAVHTMHAQVGDLRVDEDGLAVRGVLVRHLVMPGLLEDTRAIMEYLARQVSRDTYVNIMAQYSPLWKTHSQARFADINRPILPRE